MSTTDTMTRADHLKWAKDRALAYCDADDHIQAMASLASDLHKHSELVNHPGLILGARLALVGELTNAAQMRHWIEGFN